MTKGNITTGLDISRERMIQLLNEDLAGEYQAIIAYTVYSQVLKGAAYTDIARELEAHAGEELAHALKIAKQIDYLGGMPSVTPKPVKTSSDPVAMLRADLENEWEELGHALKIAKQIDYLGGMPSVTPKPVKTSSDPVAMLRADLENERETVG